MSLGSALAVPEGLEPQVRYGRYRGWYPLEISSRYLGGMDQTCGTCADKEDFHILYYSWIGTAKSHQYKNKAGGCTTTERINEESDIRSATDGNECGIDQPVKQVAEGWHRARAKYNEWTQIKVPILYKNDAKPTMCNVIFSAGNYPAFRANDGLYDGNALYVDDVELIYSSRIDKLTHQRQGVERSFNPNTDKVQTYKLQKRSADVKIR